MTEIRERESRVDTEGRARRRRQPGSLNRMIVTNLGIPDECRDPEYHYCWIKNSRGRVQALTTQDDYEVVTFDMLEETARAKRSEFTVNRDGYINNGSIVTQYGDEGGANMILCRKPLSFQQADYDEAVEARHAMMEARIYEGDTSENVAGEESLSPDVTYAPKDNVLGGATTRRRGRIPNRLK